jgi:hypothetical protein
MNCDAIAFLFLLKRMSLHVNEGKRKVDALISTGIDFFFLFGDRGRIETHRKFNNLTKSIRVD